MRKLLFALLLVAAVPAFAADRLVILSPHRKTIQAEFVPTFQEHYKQRYGTEVEVEWLDQGGTSNAVKFLGTKVNGNPAAPGIDIFWGGTSASFVDMARNGWLAPYELSVAARKLVPRSVAGVPLSDSLNRWHASAVSTFGILINRRALALEKLPEPTTWSDLGKAEYMENILATDPRLSGTNSTMNMIVLEAMGWDEGMGMLTAIAANTKRFTQSSSDPVHGVVAGDAALAMVIDFYGLGPVFEHGRERLGFTLPAGVTVLDPDGVAIVKGARNLVTAQRFVEFLMTLEAQELWMLPKGSEGGPKRENLARLAVAPAAYDATVGRRIPELNPFKVEQGFLKFDLERSGLIREPLNDLIGATMVDLHPSLQKAWKSALASGKPERLAALKRPLVSETELLAAAAKWRDQVFRNQTIVAWVKAAKERYESEALGH